ncbi:hypothetical protein [Caldicellulosiruptor morganii]|uniref:Glycine zipper domain-containing protein n=1 Tax=Caldicellulosiruptor morganii TaxID=1387555 RepID=A0ABY7BSX9_9FIRM|nr:hypothetical protein [Caldicellulosiruptor morganii]WAM34809.1 hypothetical protein OTK00_001062 [Caldicellulosiruptor morganii]
MSAKINTKYPVIKTANNHSNSVSYSSKVSTQSLSSGWFVTNKPSSQLTQPYKVTFSQISTSSQKSSTSNKTHTTNTSGGGLFGFISNIKKDISEAAKKVKDNVNAFVSSASKTVSSTVKSVEQKVSSAAKAVSHSVNNIKKDLEQTVRDVKQRVQQFVNSEKKNEKADSNRQSSAAKVNDKKDRSGGTYVITKNTGLKSDNNSEGNKNTGNISIDLSPFDPRKSPGNALSNGNGVKNVIKYTKAYIKDNFTIVVKRAEDNRKYAIIKGARSESALEEGIKGTRYAFKNAEKYPEVFKFIKGKVAVKEAFNLKSVGGKISVAGIAIDTGIDVYKDLKSKAEPSKVAADAVVDVAFGAGGMAVGALAGAAFGSVFGPIGTAAGALAGGLFYTYMTESYKVNGKSLKDAAKQLTKEVFDYAFR